MFDKLPSEIIQTIFRLLDLYPDGHTVCLVCKTWNKLIKQPNVWDFLVLKWHTLGKIYTAGNSTCGQLAQGNITHCPIFTKVTEPKEIMSLRFVDVASGHSSIAVLTDKGTVYFGGQHCRDSYFYLQALEFPEEIIQVAAGATFHLALGKSTNVYSYGNSSRHALGRTLRETVADNWTCGIVQLNPKRPIVRVTCGFEHSLVLTADGEIYSWGLGMAYQLGTNIRHNTNIPTKVITPPGIVWKDIAAGYYHSAALTTTNEIYTWGSNSDGALGILSVGTDEFTGSPTRSETPFQAKMIACGLYHTSAVDVNGKLWGTGLNNTGQLGTGDINTCRAWTKAINVDSLNFVFLSCGWVMTFVITDTSEMYSCGRDTSGELGHEAKTQTTLVRVCEPPNVKWSKVSGGCYTSAALSKAIL